MTSESASSTRGKARRAYASRFSFTRSVAFLRLAAVRRNPQGTISSLLLGAVRCMCTTGQHLGGDCCGSETASKRGHGVLASVKVSGTDGGRTALALEAGSGMGQKAPILTTNFGRACRSAPKRPIEEFARSGRRRWPSILRCSGSGLVSCDDPVTSNVASPPGGSTSHQ